MSAPLLEARGLAYFYGSRQVLHAIGLNVERGECLSIIGPNGSGKSTLFRLLCGQRKPGAGTVLIDGQPMGRLSVMERARRFAVVGQKENGSFPFSCLEMVLLGLHPFRSRFGEPTPEQLGRVQSVMERTGILHFADQQVTQISGGEFQRVLLARAIAQSPSILFLDEAMSELDIGAKIEMMKVLRDLSRSEGMAVVAVNHDLSAAWRHSDRVAALENGRLVGVGTPGEVMDAHFFASVFGVKAELLGDKGFLIHDNII